MAEADYLKALIGVLRGIWEPGDALEPGTARDRPGSRCQLCGKHPIREVYTLKNPQTGLFLEVGSECIENYKVALGLMGDVNAGPFEYRLPFTKGELRLDPLRNIDEDEELIDRAREEGCDPEDLLYEEEEQREDHTLH